MRLAKTRMTIFNQQLLLLLYYQLDGVPVPERIKTATRQMIISNFR